MDARRLFANYESYVVKYYDLIEKHMSAAIPMVVADIALNLVTTIMQDVGELDGLTGAQKKRLVTDTITLLINKVSELLNKNTSLKDVIWDDQIKSVLVTLVSPMIDSLISVENKTLVFNKKAWSGRCLRFFCIKK